MGEQEEKETPQTESTPQQEVVDEPKETDKMLEKKDETKKSTEKLVDDKKKAASKPTTPTSDKKEKSETDEKKPNGGEEIIDIPEGGAKSDAAAVATDVADERKLSAEEREVKPKKIPIGGLKLPGFFMKNKPKSDSDGAEGELLEKENKEEVAEGESKPAKKEEKPAKNFGERLRNFFVRKPAEKQAKQQAANGDADNKSGM